MTTAERFAQARPRLLRLAYSELGDLGEAEDVVQETWLRLERADVEGDREPRRLADDGRRPARARPPALRPRTARDVCRPVAAGAAHLRRRSGRPRHARRVRQLCAADRARAALARRAHGVRAARRLRRAVRRVAEVVGRTPEAVRQLASRARRHVTLERPRFTASGAEHDRAVRAFAHAVAEGDLEGLVAVLDPDVVWTSDGGGRATAARKPLYGGERVARVWMAMRRRAARRAGRGRAQRAARPRAGRAPTAIARRSRSSSPAGAIARIDAVRNPEQAAADLA